MRKVVIFAIAIAAVALTGIAYSAASSSAKLQNRIDCGVVDTSQQAPAPSPTQASALEEPATSLSTLTPRVMEAAQSATLRKTCKRRAPLPV
jgi:hypothetical protein